MTSLKNLFSSHQGKLSDKWSLYIDEYERLLKPYRDSRLNFLEIGVQNGGSIDIWSKFFPQASKLIGCDINENCGRLQYDDERIHIVIGNAIDNSVKARILDLVPELDIAIDDGSHTSEDIILSFVNYFPGIKEGGLFIVEDLHCAYWDEFGGGLYHPYSSISFFKRIIDVINSEHWGLDVSKRQYLAGFEKHYNFTIAEELLAEIHSIEFINSMCVIKKSPAQLNVLGGRISAGDQELVEAGHAQHSGEFIKPLDQTRSLDSGLKVPIELSWLEKVEKIESLEKEITSKEHDLHVMNLCMDNLKNSMSWKITYPLRMVKRLVKAIFFRA